MNRARKTTLKALTLKYHFIYRHLTISNIALTSDGFRHLIYSGRRMRPLKDIRHRISLIPQISNILEACPEPIEIRGQIEKHGNEYIPVRYYAFEANLPLGQVRLVTRQIQNNTPKFLSLIQLQKY